MLKLNTAPATEPVSLAEVKAHLRIDSEDHADDISSEQTIFPGDHVVAASYSLTGSTITVAGYKVLVMLVCGTNGASGTVDVKLQDSDNGTTWADVTSGSFTQVTEANDNATYEKAYTGLKTYLRAVATVGTATCDFGVDVIKDYSYTVEDDLLNSLITAAREYCEGFQRKAYITQTWELWLDEFPDDYIELPRPPLLEPSVTAGAFVTSTVYRILTVGSTDFTLIGASANTVGVVFTATGAGTGTGTATASGIVSYYNTSDTVAYMAASDYFVDTKSTPGRVHLGYSKSWPSTTLRPRNGVCVTYIAGYGAAASVPKSVKQAILLLIGHWYENREAITTSGAIPKEIPMAVESLLWMDKTW